MSRHRSFAVQFFRLNTIVISGAGFYSPKIVRNTDHSILNNTSTCAMDHGHASLKSHKRKSKNRIDIRNLDFFQKIESKVKCEVIICIARKNRKNSSALDVLEDIG